MYSPIVLLITLVVISIKNRKLHIGLLVCLLISVGVAVIAIVIGVFIGLNAIATVFTVFLKGLSEIG